ncbi:MAG: 50S ribosome-binding GTPase [Clostridia bacterium]|nr:50S ribosome-binding GTPase [Clostridia bacterium]
MEENVKRMNVLVLGNSGAGKSTLIRAISNTQIQTGVGEGNTQKISIYDSQTWPLRCIDTKGFEYSKREQMATIKQVHKFTKEQVSKSETDLENSVGIDAVWYCIEGTARRTFSYNIEMMNKSIKKWKNVPVFAVITKSYSIVDIDENIQAVREAFAKNPEVNLQRIIPVVAQAYVISDGTVVEPMGIEQLCELTLDCSEEAKAISEENRKRMILEQKRYSANALTIASTTAGVIIGAVPISFADSLILVPLETALTKGILKIYGVEFSGDVITSLVGSTAITNVARAALSALKIIPNIAGSVLNAVVAGFFVSALGEAIIALSEAIYLGKISPEQAENVVSFVTDKVKESPVFSFMVNYIEKNAKKLEGKSAKEIYTSVNKALKESNKD